MSVACNNTVITPNTPTSSLQLLSVSQNEVQSLVISCRLKFQFYGEYQINVGVSKLII